MLAKFVFTCYVYTTNEEQRIEIACKTEYHADLQSFYKLFINMFNNNVLYYLYY